MAPPPKPVITAAIDSAFNAVLLEAFLCGLYTLLFGYTLHALLRKQNKKVYAATLSLLWLLVMLAFAFDWQNRRTAFVIDNESSVDIAIETMNGNSVKSLYVLDNVFSMCCNLVADALLVWRCYILWEHKRWILLPFPILLIAAAVLGSLLNVTAESNKNNGIFLLSFFVVSMVITFIGTSLIVLRILLVTRSSPLTTHSSAYRKIQTIIVESGFIYTITMFITGVILGIQITIPEQRSIPLIDSVITTYTQAILIPLSGIAPTLIAVRVITEAPLQTGALQTRSRVRTLSHLTFRRTFRRDTTFDVQDRASGRADSLTDSTLGQEEQRRDDEKATQSIIA